MTERDEGAQRRQRGRAGEALDELAVELDGLGGVFDDLLHGGVAGAEIVDRDAEAAAAQDLDVAARLFAELDGEGFRQLDLDHARLDRVAFGAVAEMVADRLGVEFRRRDVDAEDRFRTEELADLAIFRHRPVDHPPVDLAEEARRLGDGDEFVRRHAAEDRGIPAQQRLAARDAAVAVDDGHVDEVEFVVGLQDAQLLLDAALAVALFVQRA